MSTGAQGGGTPGSVASLEATLYQLDSTGGNCKPAIVALIDIDSDDAWDALGRFLGSSQSAVVSFTIGDLEEVIKPGAVRALGACLGNPNAVIRRAATLALSRQQTGPSLVHLLRACRDPEHEVAQAAEAIIVRRVDDAPAQFEGVPERVMNGVFDFLDARRPYEMITERYPETVRQAAARRIGTIGDDEAAQTLADLLVDAEGDLAEACWDGFESCESVTTAQVKPLLAKPDTDVVVRALRLLTRLGSREDAEILARLTRDERVPVRAEAIVGLAEIVGAECIPVLAKALDDEEEVRWNAIDLLGDMEESTDAILRVVDHDDVEIRKRALTHLASRGVITEELMPRYIEFVENGQTCSDQSDPKYMESLAKVAAVLGEKGHLGGLAALAKLGRSTLRRLRRAAVQAIMQYRPVVRADVLHELANTYDPDVLKNVAMGLAEADDPRATIPMIRTALECRGAPAKRAKQHLNGLSELRDCLVLMEYLTRPFPSVRRFSAERLATLNDPRAIPALLVASRDEDIGVQLAVFEALGPFAAHEPKVTERMLEAIGHGDVSVRQQACEALGEARCKEAVPMLTRALSNRFLRPRAAEALKRIGDRMGILAIKRIERREKMFRKKPPPARPIKGDRKKGRTG
jgi:HEAT repeat protein